MIRLITYKKRPRTQAYTLRPRRAPAIGRQLSALHGRAAEPPRVNNEGMLFDRRASLPTATMRSSSRIDTLVSHLRGARVDGWRFVRPRLVPATVAIVGMLAVLGSAEYLTHLARYTPEQPVVVQEQPQVAQLRVEREPPPGILLLEHGPPGAMILLDGNPIGRLIQLPPSPVHVKLVPVR